MSQLGIVRTICLSIIAVGLLLVIMNAYSDQYRSQICNNHNDKDQSLLDFQEAIRIGLKNQTKEVHKLIPWDYNWDKKHSYETAADVKSIPDRTLILIRHGQYYVNTGKLTALGRDQAILTAKRLKEMNMTNVISMTHSTMERASETAQIIHSQLPDVMLGTDELLVEGGPIPPNPTIAYWSLPERDYYVDGPRLETAFRKYFYRPGKDHDKHTYEILVGHGNVFRFFSLRALQLPKDAWMRVFIGHASITMLHIQASGTVTMSKFGDTGHFPTNKVTY